MSCFSINVETRQTLSDYASEMDGEVTVEYIGE